MNNTAQKQLETGPTIEQLVKHTYGFNDAQSLKKVVELKKMWELVAMSMGTPRTLLEFMHGTHPLQHLEEQVRTGKVFQNQQYLDLKQENDFLHDKLLESYGYPPADKDMISKRLIAEAAVASARSRAQWHLKEQGRKKRYYKSHPNLEIKPLCHSAGDLQSEMSGWSDHVGGADY